MHYFKVTLNSHAENDYAELEFFYVSAKYIKNGTRYLVYILQVQITNLTEMPKHYVEVTVKSQLWHNYTYFTKSII